MARTIATVGDIYGSASQPTFLQQNSGPVAAAAGTSGASPGGNLGGGYVSAAPQSTDAAVGPVSVFQGLQGTILGNGVFLWFLIAMVAIFIYSVAKKTVPKVEEELGTPRISVSSFLSIGVQAFLFLVLVKTLLTKYNVPGLSGMAKLA